MCGLQSVDIDTDKVTDKSLYRIAPKGKFRIMAIDVVDGHSWVYGDFDTFGEACREITRVRKIVEMDENWKNLKIYVYDDKGTRMS